MLPTLSPDDIVMVDTWIYDDIDVERKHIVAFDIESRTMIKRVFAADGNQVKFRANQILLGAPLHNQSLINVEVNKHQYFLVGDNIDESYDSRRFGVVSRDKIKGKVVLVLSCANMTLNFVQ